MNLIKLTEYLRNNGVISSDILSAVQFQQGQSNPTYLITTQNDGKLVLRKKPEGHLLPGAHQIEREFMITDKLSQLGFPVAKPLFLCTDSSIIGTPFYVMVYVQGRIFKDVKLPELAPADRWKVYQEFTRVLALLHSYDINQLGLNFNVENYYRRQINTWTKQYKLSETQLVPQMEDLIAWLPMNIKQYKFDNICLCHGDYSLSNVIFHPTEFRILAVLDWELATLGQSLGDLAYMIQFYYTRPISVGMLSGGIKGINPVFLGLPDKKTIIDEYFLARQINLTEEVDLTFFVVFSMFRLAAIAQGVYKRALQGNASQQDQGLQLGQVGWNLASDAFDLVKFNNPFKINEDPQNWGVFVVSDRAKMYYEKLVKFMQDEVYPIEAEMLSKSSWKPYPQIELLKEKAKNLGLWNLFCTFPVYGRGLTNLEYAYLCEQMGTSFFGPEIFNCSAPDTGNMDLLILYANQNQRKKYLEPLLNGTIRSCFAMTEPDVASSDATNIRCTIKKSANGYIINGKKWYISGAGDERCKFAIVMGKTNLDEKPYRQQSMIIVDLPHPRVKIIRAMKVFGYDDAPHGHMEMEFDNVEVPAEQLIWEEGKGFEMAQGRLGGGRLHHCMRQVGMSRRVIDLMIQRSQQRTIFKQRMIDNQSIQQTLGRLEVKLTSAKLMVLNASAMLDKFGNKRSVTLKALSECKAYVPQVACEIMDQVIQVFGAEGVSQDQILSYAYVSARSLRIADGPDEVHLRQIAKFAEYNYGKSSNAKSLGYQMAKL